MINRELEIMKRLDNSNIVKLYDVIKIIYTFKHLIRYKKLKMLYT